LLNAAAAVARDPDRRVALCLDAPGISERRLEEEWRSAARALRPGVLSRLTMGVRFSDGRQRFFGDQSVETDCHWPAESSPTASMTRLPRADSAFTVSKLLAFAWMIGRGPVTTRWLTEKAGCSYPTAARALKQLGSRIVRHPDRRIELRPLQRQDWNRFLLTADEARSPMRFADRSGQPRSPAVLRSRLERAWPSHVGMGGVSGALHCEPQLDVAGLPRLDLSVHSPGRTVDISFVERIDPALKPAIDANEPAPLVLHFVRHADPLFGEGEKGTQIADPVECLLDLHEMRLEPQALDFLRRLTSRRPAPR
jgi:hypothetical protein